MNAKMKKIEFSKTVQNMNVTAVSVGQSFLFL
jgi:hypothetical protein